MKKHLIVSALIMSLISIATGHAAASCISSVDASKLSDEIASLSDFYGDLPTRINCLKPRGSQRLICGSSILRKMERLDHMAGVYAEENATKRKLDHTKTHGVLRLNNILNQCRTAECVCLGFKESADSSLGGLSPYYVEEASYN